MDLPTVIYLSQTGSPTHCCLHKDLQKKIKIAAYAQKGKYFKGDAEDDEKWLTFLIFFPEDKKFKKQNNKTNQTSNSKKPLGFYFCSNKD